MKKTRPDTRGDPFLLLEGFLKAHFMRLSDFRKPEKMLGATYEHGDDLVERGGRDVGQALAGLELEAAAPAHPLAHALRLKQLPHPGGQRRRVSRVGIIFLKCLQGNFCYFFWGGGVELHST